MSKIRKLKKLWSEIPKAECMQHCGYCCYYKIPISDTEINLIGEEWHRERKHAMADRCRFYNFDTGGCDIYEIRPTICRLYGNCKELKCAKGKPYKYDDVYIRSLFDRYIEIVGKQIFFDHEKEREYIFNDPEKVLKIWRKK